MHSSAVTRNRLLATAVLSFVFLASAPRAHAVSKEIVELQTQVQQLLDQVQRLQSTLDTKMGVLQHLAEQTADEANQMTTAVNALQQKLNTQNEAASGKLDSVSGQVQSLNDSVDELKARIAKLDKPSDLQTQIQNMQAPPAQTQPGGAARYGQRCQSGAPAAAPVPPTAAQQAPPLKETLEAGERDYNAGRYDIALGEFQSVVQFYPLDDLAGTAQFYLGEIAYQQKDYSTAIRLTTRCWRASAATPRLPRRNCTRAMPCWPRTSTKRGFMNCAR